MSRRRLKPKLTKPFSTRLFALCCFAGHTFSSYADPVQYTPVKWERFVKVEGQPLPVPEQWLQDEEARIAHGLRLPDSVPKPVPFNFDQARRKSWLPGNPSVKLQYFNHLCGTEAGEWIFRKVQNVEGLYFARPQGVIPSGLLMDLYGPEMPWIQRVLMLQGDYKPIHQGAWFVSPPTYNFKFVEQPRRSVQWQREIPDPYVKLFGYTQESTPDQNGKATKYMRDKTPMQVIGVRELSSQYGYTWRGVRREHDREYGIAGGEVLIYDLNTHEPLAAKRQFLVTGKNPRGNEVAAWEVAARCPQLSAHRDSREFSQFAFDSLLTVEPSTATRRK